MPGGEAVDEHTAKLAGSARDYGLNVTEFECDHPEWRVEAGFEGLGFSARRRVRTGPRGPAVAAMTLNELAAKLPEAQARPATARPGP